MVSFVAEKPFFLRYIFVSAFEKMELDECFLPFNEVTDIMLHKCLATGPACRCNRSSCIGPRASGGHAPGHDVGQVDHLCQVLLALGNSVETAYKYHC